MIAVRTSGGRLVHWSDPFTKRRLILPRHRWRVTHCGRIWTRRNRDTGASAVTCSVCLRHVPAWAYAEEKELAPLQEFADQQRLFISLLCSPCSKDHHEFCRASDPALKAHCDCGCH